MNILMILMSFSGESFKNFPNRWFRRRAYLIIYIPKTQKKSGSSHRGHRGKRNKNAVKITSEAGDKIVICYVGSLG